MLLVFIKRKEKILIIQSYLQLNCVINIKNLGQFIIGHYFDIFLIHPALIYDYIQSDSSSGMQKDMTYFELPKELPGIISATVLDTTFGQILICHDSNFMYASNISNVKQNMVFQKFSLQKVEAIYPVIRNYLIVLSQGNIVVFEVAFNEESKIMLKFAINWRPYKSYFLREVVQNMAQLQIFVTDHSFYIYQFTVNGKAGHMFFDLTPQYKIKNQERSQLYGSKVFINLQKKSIYYLKTFSDKAFTIQGLSNLQKTLCQEYKCNFLAFNGLPKIQQYYITFTSLIVANCFQPNTKHRIVSETNHLNEFITRFCSHKQGISQKNPYQQFSTQNNLRIKSYFDMILVEDKENSKTYIFHVKPKGSVLIGVEYGEFDWFWTSNRKLVALNLQRTKFKTINTIKIRERQQESSSSSKISLQNFSPRMDFKKESSDSPQKTAEQSKATKQEQCSKNSLSKNIEPKREMLYKETIVKNEQIVKSQVERNRQKAENQNYEQQSFKKQEGENNLKPIQYERFKPVKIIQRGRTSVSKTLQKSKQIDPLEKDGAKEQSVPILQIKDEKCKQQKQNIQPQMGQSQKQESRINIQKNVEIHVQSQKSQIKVSVDQKKNEDMLDQQVQISNGQIKVERQCNQNNQINTEGQKSEEQAQNAQVNSLPKRHALIIGKLNFEGVEDNPLNIFNSSINRNKIFNSVKQQIHKKEKQIHFDEKQVESALKGKQKIQQKMTNVQNNEFEYYNPFNNSVWQNKQQRQNNFLKPKQKNRVVRISPPKSQAKNQELFKLVKNLFDKTTNTLMTELEEMGKTVSSNSHYIKQKIQGEVDVWVQLKVKNIIANELTTRLQCYFKEIFTQSDKVYEKSLDYYKKMIENKVASMEVQFNNHQKIIKQIKDIEGMFRSSIKYQEIQSQEHFQQCLRKWIEQVNEAKKIIKNLLEMRQAIEREEDERMQRYTQTQQSLQEIKNMLKDRVSEMQAKKQKRIDKRLKEEERIKKAKEKKKKVTLEKEDKKRQKKQTEI